jgi:hypothetical protein
MGSEAPSGERMGARPTLPLYFTLGALKALSEPNSMNLPYRRCVILPHAIEPERVRRCARYVVLGLPPAAICASSAVLKLNIVEAPVPISDIGL